MFLHRIHLDPRCREARRDLSDPYQLHSTLCRAFSEPERKCPEGEFLWRLEPETDPAGCPSILVQSRAVPDWTRIGVQGWLANADPPVDVRQRLKLDLLTAEKRFRFRLRANPCVTRDGKRQGLLRTEEQEAWLERKGKQHGFTLPRLAAFDLSEPVDGRVDVRISQEQMLRGNQHSGNGIRIFSVLYDGFLTVTDPDRFRDVLQAGIGHGKAMGLGLLSAVPVG
ncbi:MAG: type I-E CRISPR-associated protein Cas6/Cse3/CasE [Deltaproteobacteria bacterium]|nr:type I-E CRISPR-associated protein Cas6/Cse3/CasE [Deltaproteobacteria bacterium]